MSVFKVLLVLAVLTAHGQGTRATTATNGGEYH